MNTTLARLRRSTLRLLTAALCLVAGVPALAWDDNGHVIVTRLAVEALPETLPDWLRTPRVRARLAYLASEPDRWRGQHDIHLDHLNRPEHYMDEELLRPYGLSLKTLPPLRRAFTDFLATQRALHPEKFEPYDRARDRAYTRLSPGMLPYRVIELHGKIAASWTTLKTYEQHRTAASVELIRNARENVIYHMGILSHYIGDGAQPLHTTVHYNGWAGPNPQGYTTDRAFHRLIDGGILKEHHITPASLADRARPPKKISAKDAWPQIGAYLDQTHRRVEPLYVLEKSGDLHNAAGKAFIEDRLLEAGAMLAGLWVSAYESAVIDDPRVRDEDAPDEAPKSRPARGTGAERPG